MKSCSKCEMCSWSNKLKTLLTLIGINLLFFITKMYNKNVVVIVLQSLLFRIITKFICSKLNKNSSCCNCDNKKEFKFDEAYNKCQEMKEKAERFLLDNPIASILFLYFVSILSYKLHALTLLLIAFDSFIIMNYPLKNKIFYELLGDAYEHFLSCIFDYIPKYKERN